MTGNPEYHSVVRQRLCDYVDQNHEWLETLMVGNNRITCVAQYLLLFYILCLSFIIYWTMLQPGTPAEYVNNTNMRRDKKYINTTFLHAAARWLDCHIVYQSALNLRLPTEYSWQYCSPDSVSLWPRWPENDDRPTLLLRLRDVHIMCVKRISTSSAVTQVSNLKTIFKSLIFPYFKVLFPVEFLAPNCQRRCCSDKEGCWHVCFNTYQTNSRKGHNRVASAKHGQ